MAELLPLDNGDSKSEDIKKIEADLTQAGVANTYGYRQYFFDSDRE